MHINAILMADEGVRSFDSKAGVFRFRSIRVIEWPNGAAADNTLCADELPVRLVLPDGKPDEGPLMPRQMLRLALTGIQAAGDRLRVQGFRLPDEVPAKGKA